MNVKISYNSSKALDKKVREEKYIPYRTIRKQKYYRNNYYYNAYWDMCFRVISATYSRTDGELVTVYVKSDDHMYHLLSTDLDNHDYLLIPDTDNIKALPNIINTKRSFTGAEIIYWFFTHDIDCFNKKYKGFWKFVDPASAHRVSDTTRYNLIGKLDQRGIYRECIVAKANKKTGRI